MVKPATKRGGVQLHMSRWAPLSGIRMPPSASTNAINGRFYSSSKSCNAAETMEFQAETRKLLDIVTNSIYTDKEVFIRELISNASDALEKLRYSKTSGSVVSASNDADAEPTVSEISLITDPENLTLTIIDNGIGMTKAELISNLGTIARSGSKQFINEHAGDAESGGAVDGIIGQFGVGFYSSFMVSEAVTVQSMSGLVGDGSGVINKWSSDGSGQFAVEELAEDSVDEHLNGHGTKIVLQLKESCKEYADAEKLKAIIKKYSNFVAFPVKVDGEVVNTVSAIWTQEKSSVTEAQYDEFYRFIANAYDKPKYRLHFRTDAPIDLKCLFYVPTFHGEKFGQGRTELGVNLYSRKVLY